MFLSSNTPYVRISYNGQPFDLIFDTGNVKSNLGSKFAKTFTDTIEGLTEQATSLGGTNTSEVGEFRIISLDFNDGDWRVRWKVIPEPAAAICLLARGTIATGVTANFLILPFRNLE